VTVDTAAGAKSPPIPYDGSVVKRNNLRIHSFVLSSTKAWHQRGGDEVLVRFAAPESGPLRPPQFG
jgi:hypothetical protein